MYGRVDHWEASVSDFSCAAGAFNKEKYSLAAECYESAIAHLQALEPNDDVYCKIAENYINLCDTWLHLNEANKANHAIQCFYQSFNNIHNKKLYVKGYDPQKNDPQLIFNAYQKRVSFKHYPKSDIFQVQHEVLTAYAGEIEMEDVSSRMENVSMDLSDPQVGEPSLEMTSKDWTRLSIFYTKSVKKKADSLNHDVLLKLYENILQMLDHIENKTAQDYRLICQVHSNRGNLYHQQKFHSQSASSYQAARQALLSIWWREDGDNAQIGLLERNIVGAQSQNRPVVNYSVEDDLASLMRNLTIEQNNRKGEPENNLHSIMAMFGKLQIDSQPTTYRSPRSGI